MRTVVVGWGEHSMRLRKFAALIVPLASLSCGGHSTATAPSSARLDLVTGAYALTVTMSSSGEPVCSNGICFSGGACVGVGPPSLRPVTTAVRLDRSGDAISIRPEDASASFRMQLRVEPNGLTGTASGEFRDGGAQLSIVSPQSGAGVTGTVLASSVAGKIDGQVGVNSYSCSNNGHAWNLVPR